MKKLYTAFYIVLLACAAGSVVFLLLLPDRVPLHYGFNGEPDRFGSKYENILWPLIAVAAGAFFLLAARRQRKTKDASSEKLLLIIGLGTALFLTALGFYVMYRGLRYDAAAAQKLDANGIYRLENIGIGALLAVFGILMPQARRNAWFGVRTKRSMENDAVWQKSQRFGGAAAVIAGGLLIVSALFVPGVWNLAVLLGVLTALPAACVVAARRYSARETDGDK